MADSQFNPLGSVTAPADWTIPPSLNVELKNVYASFDGTGAGGSFVPCLQIISDSGHTVGSYPCTTTVAAGASADVTWFPRVGARSSTNPVVSNELDYVEITSPVTVLPANSSSNQKVMIQTNPIAFDGVTRVRIECYAPLFDIEGNNYLIIDLWDNSTDLGRWGQADLDPNPTDLGTPLYLARYYTPTAGTHVFAAKGWTAPGTGTAAFYAGPGGLPAMGDPNYMPAWIRVST